jgi:hypothetical protein
MRVLNRALFLGLTTLITGLGACQQHPEPAQVSPDPRRHVVMPAPGDTEDSVLALNGPPDRQTRADSLDLWVYARMTPEGRGIRLRNSMIWFQNGTVVDTATGGAYTEPTPTFPPAFPDSSRAQTAPHQH